MCCCTQCLKMTGGCRNFKGLGARHMGVVSGINEQAPTLEFLFSGNPPCILVLVELWGDPCCMRLK